MRKMVSALIVILIVSVAVAVGFVLVFKVQDEMAEFYTFNKAYETLESDGYELIDIRTTQINLYAPQSNYSMVEIQDFTKFQELARTLRVQEIFFEKTVDYEHSGGWWFFIIKDFEVYWIRLPVGVTLV